MKWSTYQTNIFNDVQHGSGNTIVKALAGSGKTTSIIESLKYIPANSKWLLVAFNKNIAETLKKRAPQNANGEICTLHSLGLKSLGKTYKNVTVDNNKVDTILELALKKETYDREAKYALKQAVSLCKCYLASSSAEIEDVLDEHDLVPEGINRAEFINHIIFTLDICKRKPNIVDFDDMIYLNNVLNTNVPKFDIIIVDEGQDLNKSQIEFILKMRNKDSRTFVFLDQNQAIYSWRGADINAMNTFQLALKAKLLPLSITYRCPLAVVREAQKFVPDLEAAPSAAEGKVAEINYKEMLDLAKPGCFIISRLNAPLIGLALSFIKKSIPCNIQGRDIGENLLDLVKRSRAKNINKFIIFVEKWQKKECERLTSRNKSTTLVQDKAECLFALAENCDSVQDLKNKLKYLFTDTDDSKKIILGTTHKLKGLERDTVFVLTSTFRYNTQEERNLGYVARTRSADTLYLVKNKKSD